MIHLTRRIIRFWGWLLTPAVAWAASFLGAVIAGLLVSHSQSAWKEFLFVVIFAVLTASLTTVLWRAALKRSARLLPWWQRRRRRSLERQRRLEEEP